MTGVKNDVLAVMEDWWVGVPYCTFSSHTNIHSAWDENAYSTVRLGDAQSGDLGEPTRSSGL